MIKLIQLYFSCSNQKTPISSETQLTPEVKHESDKSVTVKAEPVPGAPVTPKEAEEGKKVQRCKLNCG